MSTPFPTEIMRHTITVHRRSAGSFDANDRWVEGSETPVVHNYTSVQPASGRDLKVLPEGRRVDSIIRIYDIEPLYGSDKTTDTSPDVVEWQGERYEVINVQVWKTGVIDYYVALADRERQ